VKVERPPCQVRRHEETLAAQRRRERDRTDRRGTSRAAGLLIDAVYLADISDHNEYLAWVAAVAACEP